MRRQGTLKEAAPVGFHAKYDRHHIFGDASATNLCINRRSDSCKYRARISCRIEKVDLIFATKSCLPRSWKTMSIPSENFEVICDEDDDDLCPVDCVKEFKTDEKFFKILEKAERSNSLVVVDFYRTSCGSCKYIEQGFAKLCKGSGDEGTPVIILKHNVLDEYDE